MIGTVRVTMKIKWTDGFWISVRTEDGTAAVSANREGLLSLAEICRSLAGESPGAHVHLDKWNSLEDGSSELIIELAE